MKKAAEVTRLDNRLHGPPKPWRSCAALGKVIASIHAVAETRFGAGFTE
jgi:hypothetical protein